MAKNDDPRNLEQLERQAAALKQEAAEVQAVYREMIERVERRLESAKNAAGEAAKQTTGKDTKNA